MMSYSQLALTGVVLALVFDLLILRTRLVTRKAFWASYGIIVFFQLVSNATLTGLRIVRYDGAFILGSSTPTDSAPPFLGDGRIAFAPVEDLLFGFALVLCTLALWIFWGRHGIQRLPAAGPPRAPFNRFAPRRNRDGDSAS